MAGERGGRAAPAIESLVARFEGRDALLGVVGLGYVGLPVATTFADAGFKVVGVDTDPARVVADGALVILESTTYPGTTEEVLRPLLEAGGRAAGADFLLAYSPERIDPGNPQYGFREIPKVVGGVTPQSTRAAEVLYSQVVPKVIAVSSPREAEMAKLLENIFRHVNIALVNELATYAHDMDIDIWEAVEAAATKPFGYMPFFPGPGWGGHCIPLDPAYLSWRGVLRPGPQRRRLLLGPP